MICLNCPDEVSYSPKDYFIMHVHRDEDDLKIWTNDCAKCGCKEPDSVPLYDITVKESPSSYHPYRKKLHNFLRYIRDLYG